MLWKPELTSAYLHKQQIETQTNNSRTFDFISYWTGSRSKISVLILLISFGLIVTTLFITHPNQEITDVRVWNNTVSKKNPQDFNFRTITTKSATNYTYVSLAVVVGIILLVLWPSIKNFTIDSRVIFIMLTCPHYQFDIIVICWPQ